MSRVLERDQLASRASGAAAGGDVDVHPQRGQLAALDPGSTVLLDVARN